jgi:ribosomal protein S18 acetylase RimI-like enzyme
MTLERAFLIAPVEALLIAEPTEDSRTITDADLRDVAQTLVDAAAGIAGHEITVEMATALIAEFQAGTYGEPRRDAWRGIWEGSGPPVSVVLCTSWRGMPYIAGIATAPNSQNRGLATSLVREVANVFYTTGDSHIGLALERDNPAAHLFGELGFKEMFSAASV